jgi:hypothetical protein
MTIVATHGVGRRRTVVPAGGRALIDKYWGRNIDVSRG